MALHTNVLHKDNILLELYKSYLIVGGMPLATLSYFEKTLDFKEAQNLIINTILTPVVPKMQSDPKTILIEFSWGRFFRCNGSKDENYVSKNSCT
jgi:hypothetical protein